LTKNAFITGITGQDGCYLARHLIDCGYKVAGLIRPHAQRDLTDFFAFVAPNAERQSRLSLHFGDLLDGQNLVRLLSQIQPSEIYNLGAQSHVHISFDMAEYTGNVCALGALRLLEAIRILDMGQSTRYYQASTSELFGIGAQVPQNEETKVHPRSPYATAKQYAYSTTGNYREAYGLHASNGILFNHESPLRGAQFVTRKIARAAAQIASGSQQTLSLGNLDAVRDWGHAKDYVRGMHLMLKQILPDDYVLATGIGFTVRDFATFAFQAAGIQLDWQGEGLNETAHDANTGQVLIEVDNNLFRPAEADCLVGDASKANKKLGWSPTISVEQLIEELVAHEMNALKSAIQHSAFYA
jgi:GDPmannose 4,6-dehydratase